MLRSLSGRRLAAAGLLAVASGAAPLGAQPAARGDSAARGRATAADTGAVRDAMPAARRAPPSADSLLATLAPRSLGPAVTSGRIADVAVPDGPEARRRGRLGKVMYVASATGGLWKTTNGGTTWQPVFDRESSVSLGDVTVAPSNPDVVWVGTGEANNMRSSSWGDGVYKSENGGRTWTHMGLRTSQHVGRIVIHPTDPDIVYVAAVGPLWASGGERGLYKTTDGGKTWTAALTVSPHTGVTEVAMDPRDPDVLYAATLQRQRKAYSYVGGGPESGIWKSTDAGRTWTRLKEGLPTTDLGRIGLSVSESHPQTIYATIEGTQNGQSLIYRSDDYGASWRRTAQLSSIPWFFGQIRVDPNDPERVYHLAVQLQMSEDGGRTFRSVGGGVHADQHALWIDPTDSDHLVLGNDGGLYLSYDGAGSWDFVPNLPVSQFYAIGVDLRTPYYYVYGGLQDNASWGAPSQTRTRAGITNSDWFRMTGGDGFYAVVEPTNPNVVYAESQNGGIVRFDAQTGETKTIKPLDVPGERPYRWNWSAPILISPHDPATVYFAANYLFRSPNRGDSWQRLGGDLTRQRNRDSLPLMGRLWPANAVARHQGTADYGNISTIDESPRARGVLWVGTDDGLVQLSRDGGQTWTRFDRFPGVPEETYVSRVVASPSAEGTAYVAFDGHRSNDFKPYLFKTTDFGRTWTPIMANLPANGPVYVVREHHESPNLLFAGTEFGLFASLDGGRSWAPMRRELPTVPVADLVIHPRDGDLVVGTHGRGIFIYDDVSPLLRLAGAREAAQPTLFPVRAVTLYNPSGAATGGPRGAGNQADRTYAADNPPFGAAISLYLPEPVGAGGEVTLTIVDSAGARLRELPVQRGAGLQRVVWNLRLNPPYTVVRPAGQQGGGGGGGGGGFGGGGFGGGPQGAYVLPGSYVAELRVTRRGGAPVVQRAPVVVRPDPLVTLTAEEYRRLHDQRLAAGRMQATVQAVVRSAEGLDAQIAEVRAALRSGTTAPDSLRRQVDAVARDVADVLRKVRGGGGGPGGGAGGGGEEDDDEQGGAAGRPSIQQRVNSVAQQIGNVSSLPTELQQRTLEGAMGELRTEVGRLNALVSTAIPAVNRALDAAQVPWTIGRPIPWLGGETGRVP